MRAYMAVIKDSFREAFASKILWVLIILITLFLLLLAGFSVNPAMRTSFERRDVIDMEVLALRLRDAEADSPAGRIRERLGSDLKEELSRFQPATAKRNSKFELFGKIRDKLDDELENPEFASEINVSDEKLTEEARGLAGRGDRLQGREQLRLNRLVLEAALPDDILASPSEVVSLSYIGFALFAEENFSHKELETGINGLLQVFIFLFVSVIGTLIAIVVTAPIVPRMFEGGAIDLLLSKPVSRSLLFLSKFFGGCAFTLVNAAFLIIGMWLIIGLRLGVWSNGLLLSIPVYLFLFVLYYSISAAAGVVYRGPIISVVMVFVFWFLCFVVGTAKDMIENFEVRPSTVYSIIATDEGPLAINMMGHVHAWSESRAAWEPVFSETEQQRQNMPGFARVAMRMQAGFPFVGARYDQQNKRLVVLTRNIVFPMPGNGPSRLFVGRRDDDWARRGGTGGSFPPRALLISPKGKILAVGMQGVQEFLGDPEKTTVSRKWMGLDFTLGEAGGQFVDATPVDMTRWRSPFDATIDSTTGNIIVFSAGELIVLKPGTANGKTTYTPNTTRDLDTEEAALITAAGGRLLVALADGDYRLLDSATLQPTGTSIPTGPKKPRQAVASPDGRFLAVVSHKSEAWLIDATTGKEISDSAVSGDVHAVAFDAQNHLLVGDVFMRVTSYSVPDFNPVKTHDPTLSTLQAVYRYAVLPIYTVFPKPGELNAVIARLFEDSDTVTVSGNNEDLQADQFELDIRTPLVSNAAFLLVMLALTCLYVSRKDF